MSDNRKDDLETALVNLRHNTHFQLFAEWIRAGKDNAVSDLVTGDTELSERRVGNLATYVEILDAIDEISTPNT